MNALSSLLAGFGLGLSLIMAIGAQNAFVLRQALRGEHIVVVVAICAVSDAVLIAAGVGGMGALLAENDRLLDVIRLAGAAFLLGYAALALRRARRGESLRADAGGATTSLAAAVTTTLALTWLNPHVYLDTVLLLGSVAHGYDEPGAFGAGAALGSLVWFSTLGFGGRHLRRFFARPAAWRALDVAIAVLMTAIAVSLLLPLL